MNEIHRVGTPHQASPSPHPASVRMQPVERIDPVVRPDVLGRMNTLAMTSMLSKVRRPPLMRSSASGAGRASAYDDMLETWSEPLDALSTVELSYRVSMTLQRRLSDDADHGHPDMIGGLQALDRIARMYEHLAILQSGPNDVG